MKYIQVITTTDKRQIANTISGSLIRKGLAACVQTWPITSTFRWKNKVQTGREWILLIKAKASDYRKIENEIRRMHNYELPEIISVPILTGSKNYLAWIDDTTKRKRIR